MFEADRELGSTNMLYVISSLGPIGIAVGAASAFKMLSHEVEFEVAVNCHGE